MTRDARRTVTALTRRRGFGGPVALEDAVASLLDGAVASLLAADLVLEALFSTALPTSSRLPTVIAALALAGTVAWRRRAPCLAVFAAAAILLADQLAHGQLMQGLPTELAAVAPMLCAYGAGAWGPTLRSRCAAALAAILVYATALVAVYVDHARHDGWGGGIGDVIVFVAVPYLVGVLIAARSARIAEFAALERSVLADRAERERAVLEFERDLIGRELHDAVEARVRAMAREAAIARELLHDAPDVARQRIADAERDGRAALADMRELLGMLRRPEGGGANPCR